MPFCALKLHYCSVVCLADSGLFWGGGSIPRANPSKCRAFLSNLGHEQASLGFKSWRVEDEGYCVRGASCLRAALVLSRFSLKHSGNPKP